MDNAVMQVKVREHDETLKEHDRRLDKIEQDGAEFKVQIQHLCDDIKNLTTTLKWFMGLLGGSFIGFFFYAAQRGLLK